MEVEVSKSSGVEMEVSRSSEVVVESSRWRRVEMKVSRQDRGGGSRLGNRPPVPGPGAG